MNTASTSTRATEPPTAVRKNPGAGPRPTTITSAPSREVLDPGGRLPDRHRDRGGTPVRARRPDRDRGQPATGLEHAQLRASGALAAHHHQVQPDRLVRDDPASVFAVLLRLRFVAPLTALFAPLDVSRFVSRHRCTPHIGSLKGKQRGKRNARAVPRERTYPGGGTARIWDGDSLTNVWIERPRRRHAEAGTSGADLDRDRHRDRSGGERVRRPVGIAQQWDSVRSSISDTATRVAGGGPRARRARDARGRAPLASCPQARWHRCATHGDGRLVLRRRDPECSPAGSGPSSGARSSPAGVATPAPPPARSVALSLGTLYLACMLMVALLLPLRFLDEGSDSALDPRAAARSGSRCCITVPWAGWSSGPSE